MYSTVVWRQRCVWWQCRDTVDIPSFSTLISMAFPMKGREGGPGIRLIRLTIRARFLWYWHMNTKTNTNTSTTGFSSNDPNISLPKKKKDWRKLVWSFETLCGTNISIYMRRVAGKERHERSARHLNFQDIFRPTLGHTKPPYKMGTGSLSRGQSGRCLTLTTHLHIVPRLKKE